jgi:hypothetical protein
MDRSISGSPVTHFGETISASDVAKAYEPVISGMSQYGGVVCTGCMAMSAEWVSFLNWRLRAGMSLPARIASCGTPQDLIQTWTDFWSHAAADCQTECQRLAAISARLSGQSAVPPTASGSKVQPTNLRAA